MNKKFFLSIPLLCLLTLPAFVGQESIKSDASTITHLVVDDNFNNSDFKGKTDSSKWIDYSSGTIGQSLTGATYMYNHQSYAGVEHVDFSTKNELTNIKYYQFDYKWDDDSLGCSRWFSLYFVDEPSVLVANQYGPGAFLAYAGVGSFTSTGISGLGATNFDGFNLSSTLDTNAVDNWITVRITPITDTTGKISIAKQGEEFKSENEKTFSYVQEGCSLLNGYVMLGASHDAGGFMIDNIEISYATDGLIEENFDDFDPEVNPNFQFEYFNNATADLVSIDFVCNSKLEFGNASNGGYVATKQEIEEDDAQIEDMFMFEVSFDFYNPGDDTVSLVFGLEETDSQLRKNSVVYEMSSSKAILREYDADGNITTEDKKNTNSFGKVKTTGSTISMTYTLADGLTIYENGTKVKNSGAKVTFANVGNVFGHCAIELTNKNAGTAYVDNLKIYNSYYYIPVTKSVTHNFSNDFWGNEGYEDFYVHDPSGAGIQKVENGRLVWDMASDTTFFGSAHQYDNFILDFKLCTIKADITKTDTKDITAVNKWIGLDLSRPTVDYFEYGSYLTHITMITQPETATTASVSMWNQTSSSFDKNALKQKNFANVDPDLFRAIQYKDDSEKSLIKEEDAVCFRYVSNNGTLSFYLKKASESQYTKYWEYYDLELNGYFALCCTGWTYLELDDFSMSNTSDVYVCADNEAPETITEIVEHTIYDNQNADVDFDEEIKINSKSGGCGSSLLVSSSIVAVVGIIGAIGVIIRKKH